MLIDVYLLPWDGSAPGTWQQRPPKLASHPKLHRLAAVTLAVVAYAKLRSWLAGDHLVRIYRKVRQAHKRLDGMLQRRHQSQIGPKGQLLLACAGARLSGRAVRARCALHAVQCKLAKVVLHRELLCPLWLH